MAKTPATKRLQIDKANSSMVTVIATATFLLVFSLVAGKSLLSQRSYQARVIDKKETARDTLKANVESSKSLTNYYKAFTSTSSNIIGGNPGGNGDRDGDSAKIILDALPYTYDFPGLASSIEKIMSKNSLKIQSISGSDDQVAQQVNVSSPTPQPIAIPFQVTASGSYKSIQSLFEIVERSIRPIQIQNLSLSGGSDDMTINFTAQTFYQPSVSIEAKTEEVQ